ncbi:MAG: alcohol dehydrogenase [Chloroflexota bacterium]|nr:MAG: alcohol dehydrogenase [Chloroflexota bacterium]
MNRPPTGIATATGPDLPVSPWDAGSFRVGRLPTIEFGRGRVETLPERIVEIGRRVLLVTGRRSLEASGRLGRLLDRLAELGAEVERVVVEGEPTPDLVDGTVSRFRSAGIEVVVGIGGGSALDAAKAIAGLLRTRTSILDHLEGVGRGIPYGGPAVPFVAVPTTAGTGSEATRNAVITRPGPDGFKRSFRDERLVAQLAVVDPDLLLGLAPETIAGNGMDACTQLIEAYVSTGAGAFTDGLALAGLEATRDGLLRWHAAVAAGDPGPAETAPFRERMAFAALASGICLAQAGLGAVHGIVAPLGALTGVGHGTGCGILLAETTRTNLRALAERAPQHRPSARYARIARLLLDEPSLDDSAALAALPDLLADWARRLGLPRLRDVGLREADIDWVVERSRGSSMRTNPIVLTDAEIAGILRAAL